MKLSGIICAALLAASLIPAAKAAEPEPSYIFYFIGDGMGHGAVAAAEDFLRSTTERPDTSLLFTSFPVASYINTRSASSPVTDSAAAGTALATGTKTRNGMIGMNPDTLALTSVAKLLQNRGYGIGVLTTVAADDATPAAFYANVPSRNMYYEIGRQAAQSGFDFIGGAGLRGFSDKQGRPTNLASEFDRNGYTFVRSVTDPAICSAKKIVMLSPDTLHNYRTGYSIEAPESALTLPAMTASAISHLEKVKPERFFLMVEGGAIDHAAHANDAGSVIADVLAFDDAVRLAYNFYLAHPEQTTIIVTADHETGGMTLGNSAMGYAAATPLLRAQRISKDTMSNLLRERLDSSDIPSWDEMKALLENTLGFGTTVELSADEWTQLEDSYRDTFILRTAKSHIALYNRFVAFAADAFRILDTHTGIGWTSIHHTGNPVPVFAVGNGAHSFSRRTENTSIPLNILRLTGSLPSPQE